MDACLCVQPVPVRRSSALYIWLPDVPLLTGSIYSDISFLHGSASPNHIGDMTRGRRAFPECLNSCALGQYQGVGHFSFRKGSSPAALGLGTGIQKGPQMRTVFFLRVMPSSHTPSGSCQKTGSREKDLGARSEPRPTRKMSAFFSGF